MSLDSKILDVIKQGLPEATVGAFKERMEELEQLANQVPDLKEKIVTMGKSYDTLKKERDILKGYENRIAEIERGEECLKAREINLKIKEGIHEVRVELMNTRVNDHKEMFNTVFKNPTLRTEIFTNKNKNNSNDPTQNTDECNNTTIRKVEE